MQSERVFSAVGLADALVTANGISSFPTRNPRNPSL